MAPEGASRCRAVASGLVTDRSAEAESASLEDARNLGSVQPRVKARATPFRPVNQALSCQLPADHPPQCSRVERLLQHRNAGVAGVNARLPVAGQEHVGHPASGQPCNRIGALAASKVDVEDGRIDRLVLKRGERLGRLPVGADVFFPRWFSSSSSRRWRPFASRISVLSVFVPNQRTTSPCSSCTGSARDRNQRKTLSCRRSGKVSSTDRRFPMTSARGRRHVRRDRDGAPCASPGLPCPRASCRCSRTSACCTRRSIRQDFPSRQAAGSNRRAGESGIHFRTARFPSAAACRRSLRSAAVVMTSAPARILS